MWLDAIVTSADLQQLVDQMTPATVPLGERGHLFFDAPADVSLVADRGLKIRCHAKLLWPVLGIDVAVTVRSMTVVLVPSIESRDGARVVVLSPEVDALDLAVLPDIADDELRAYINRELQAKRIELPWNYKETLDHRFVLPDWFRASSTFDIRSDGAAVKITNDSIGLAIGFRAAVLPTESYGEQGTGASKSKTVDSPQTAALATRREPPRFGAVGLAIVSGFALGCLAGLWSANRT
jgi:hypothetical protein